MFDGPILTASHFTWREVIRSKKHPELEPENLAYLQSRPDIQENVRTLVHEFLEPLRVQLGQVNVHSWLRCPSLNAADGGVADSQHLVGSACDFDCELHSIDAVVEWIRHSALPYHQLIREPRGVAVAGWVHVGAYVPGAARNSQYLR